MSNKSLITLGIITVCMIIWAIVQSRIANIPRAELNASSNLVQGLNPDDVDTIVLGSGDDVVKLKREGERFVVGNKDNYPAVTSEINNLIASCLDIKTSEFYTDNPKNFKDLNVTEDDAQNVVKFLKSDSSLLTGIIVGKSKDQGQGTFVKKVDDDKVYVALETPSIRANVDDYINQDIITVNRDDIEYVTVTTSGKPYTLKNESGSSVMVEGLPEGKKVKEGEAESVFAALTNLRFKDVKSRATFDEKLVFDKQFVCKLKNSTIYSIQIATNNDTAYIMCESEFTDKTPVVKGEGVESEEELRKKESKLLALEKTEKFQTTHNGWVYEIDEYSAKNLYKELSGLIEDDDEKEDSEEETKLDEIDTSSE